MEKQAINGGPSPHARLPSIADRPRSDAPPSKDDVAAPFPPMGDRTGSREMNGSLSRRNHRPGKTPPQGAAYRATTPPTGKGVGVNETSERLRDPIRTPAGLRRLEVS
jgi:hypothetical protein